MSIIYSKVPRGTWVSALESKQMARAPTHKVPGGTRVTHNLLIDVLLRGDEREGGGGGVVRIARGKFFVDVMM